LLAEVLPHHNSFDVTSFFLSVFSTFCTHSSVCTVNDVEKPKAYVPPALRGQPQLVNKPKYREAYEPDSFTKQQLAEHSTCSHCVIND